MSNTLKSKMQNTKINFSRNIITAIIVPAVALVLAFVFAILFGFHQGMDFKGGISLSVVSETLDLNLSKNFEEYKSKVDVILNNNGVTGSVYLVETESTNYNDVLVVKIDYTGNDSNKIADSIKLGLSKTFYPTVSNDEIELRHLVTASTFGPSVDAWQIVSTILASLVATILLSAYILIRNGVHSGVLAFLSAIISSVLSWSLILITRVPVNSESLAVVPFVCVLACLFTFLFTKNAKTILSTTNKFSSKSNYELANETIKSKLPSTITIVIGMCLISLLIALANINNPVLYFGLCLLEAVVAVMYTSLFVIPAIFGLTYVRKIKKEKVKKEDKKDQKLEESEILKETDLDNLVSN